MATYKGTNKDENGNILLAVPANMAPVETTLTASQAYTEGEYFIYSNNLYVVTSAIASGGTIIIGTNASLVPSIGAEVSKLNSSLSDNYGGTNNKFRFATDGAGNFGYLKADDSFAPFKNVQMVGMMTATMSGSYCFVGDLINQSISWQGMVDFLAENASDLFSSVVHTGAGGSQNLTFTVAKAGKYIRYYAGQQYVIGSVEYNLEVGQTISWNPGDGASFVIIYYG